MHCSAVLAVQHIHMQSVCAYCRTNTAAAHFFDKYFSDQRSYRHLSLHLCTMADPIPTRLALPHMHFSLQAQAPLFMCRTFIQDPVIAADEHSVKKHAVNARLDA